MWIFPVRISFFPIFPAPLERTFRSSLSTMVAPPYLTDRHDGGSNLLTLSEEANKHCFPTC